MESLLFVAFIEENEIAIYRRLKYDDAKFIYRKVENKNGEKQSDSEISADEALSILVDAAANNYIIEYGS